MKNVFGAPQPGTVYRDRPGAYGVAFDSEGRAAVVHCPNRRYFLLGGGMEPGEDEAACICREALEETGMVVTVKEPVCAGEEFIIDSSGRPLHLIGHVYLIELGEKLAEPLESDHALTWIPVEAFQRTAVLRYQAWAMGVAWEAYQKQQKENRK